VEAGLKIFRPSKSLNQQGQIIIRQTVSGFKFEKTEAELTDHGLLALLGEYNYGLWLRVLSDRHLPGPDSNRGYAASAFVDSLILLLRTGDAVRSSVLKESFLYHRKGTTNSLLLFLRTPKMFDKPRNTR
jgi:hypothetical protein